MSGQHGVVAVRVAVGDPEPKPEKSFKNQRMEELSVQFWRKQKSATLRVAVPSSFLLITREIRLKHFFLQCVSRQNGQGGVSAQNPVGEVNLFEPERSTSPAVTHLANMRL